MLTETQKRLAKAIEKMYPQAPIMSVKMRNCNDIPNFISMVKAAHRSAEHSTLKFD